MIKLSLLFAWIDIAKRSNRRWNMNVQLNGENILLPENIVFVSDVLNHYQIHDKVVVVEINGEILTRMEHQSTRLSDRDRIEIVHFVGGG